MKRTYTFASLCCGLGGHALGMLRAVSEAGSRFRSVGAVDIDPLACAAFKLLTGADATQLDLATAEPADLARVIPELTYLRGRRG